MKPATIAHLAPRAVRLLQKRLRIITGQKVAAIPDQPKMIVQKTPSSLSTSMMPMPIRNDTSDRPSVTLRVKRISRSSSMSGFLVFCQ